MLALAGFMVARMRLEVAVASSAAVLVRDTFTMPVTVLLPSRTAAHLAEVELQPFALRAVVAAAVATASFVVGLVMPKVGLPAMVARRLRLGLQAPPTAAPAPVSFRAITSLLVTIGGVRLAVTASPVAPVIDTTAVRRTAVEPIAIAAYLEVRLLSQFAAVRV